MKKMKHKLRRKDLRLKNKKKRELNKKELQLVKKSRSLLKRLRSLWLTRKVTMKSLPSREITSTKTLSQYSSSFGTIFLATTRPKFIRFSRELETRENAKWSIYLTLRMSF